jgi:F-type H+-transporting ATPase subunit epsilon
MSEKTFKLTVVSPDKSLIQDLPVIAVGAKGVEGDFTALPGHVPFLTDLKPGVMWFRSPDHQDKEVFVSAGFAEVLPGGVTVLADSCEYPGEIDLARAERARLREEAKFKRLKSGAGSGALTSEGEIEIKKAEIKLNRAIARINAAKRPRKN